MIETINSRLENKDGLTLLVEAVKKLNLIPRTGYGEAKINLLFQDGTLVFTEDSFLIKNKTQVKIKVE